MTPADKCLPINATDSLPRKALCNSLGSVQFVDAGSLGAGALGAYDSANGGTLYLDRSLLNGEPAKLQSVFNEEMGHHLDAVLGGADAAGDEGAVFAQTLEQGPLDQNTLSLLRSENDHGLILVEGRLIEVEFRTENEGSGDGHGAQVAPARQTVVSVVLIQALAALARRIRRAQMTKVVTLIQVIPLESAA